MRRSVLFLEGQTVQALPCLESLKRKGYQTHIFCKNISYGCHSRFTDQIQLTVDCQKDPLQYKQDLLEYLEKNKIDVIIPMNDEVSPFTSKFKKEINKVSNVLIPQFEVFLKGFDKNQLMGVCKSIGIDHPNSCDLNRFTLKEASEYVGFPAIIKPNHTSGARGMKVVHNYNELHNYAPAIIKNFGDSHLQTFVPAGGKQFKVQIFTDNKDIHISTAMEKIRFYPVSGGSSTCNITIENNELVEMCSKVLKHIGWVGFADFDLIQDPRDGRFKIMEINPRLPACIRTAFVSGVDFAEIIVDYTLTGAVKTYVYSPGKILRYFGLDLLWLLKAKKRSPFQNGWFNLFGRNVYYQDGSLKDPIPFLIGTIENIKKLLNPEFKKAKQGLG
ncbi:ATP-grasp domain-containing protein [uncultured Desulfobacter sp.]|uniref:carboxylate--amine ligase n=1 Tax=uncultured Desulfobacter sp. TaxID=240139 RepID=UPI0029F512F4|nr:ATP-grasp domain-containing protein [uncultured Desulfobacter sp.]